MFGKKNFMTVLRSWILYLFCGTFRNLIFPYKWRKLAQEYDAPTLENSLKLADARKVDFLEIFPR